MPVPETIATRPLAFIEANADPYSKKFTDESRVYGGLANHETVNHDDGEYARDEVHTSGMESFWTMVRRGHDGPFHHIEPKRLRRYVNEFVGRLGMKAPGIVGKMRALVQNLVGKSLTYGQFVASGMLYGWP